MILTISGLHGTGKSTIGKILSQKLGIKYYSTGQAFRELAEEMEFSLEEFTDYVEKNPHVDKKLDEKIIEIALKDNIIIDSQLSAYILDSIADFKILLTCPLETRVNRMSERDSSNYEEKLKETSIREKSELIRFNKLYDIDLNNQSKIEKLYDLIIDTTELTIDEVVELIFVTLKKKKLVKSNKNQK
ncbi:MAG: (d)CMP kinase [Promethearchaeota archaeon]|jgi:predicted cytidylate kinase